MTVSDGTASITQNITVSISNINESPTINSSATFSADENQTSIGSVSASDPDGDSLTYSISGSEINISSSGVLTFASAPDYETKNSYTATVTVSDGTASGTQNITVNVTNLNDKTPVITSSATFSADENQTGVRLENRTGTGVIVASDAEGDSLTYSVSGSEINISSSGVLTFASAPDYETKNSYTATVTVSDGTNSSTQAITVNIINMTDNPPTITSADTFAVDENSTGIFTYLSASGDAADGFTWSVSGSELAFSGEGLSFVSSPDYETKSSYTATVTVSDGIFRTTQNITININNLDDAPPSFSSADYTFYARENQTSIYQTKSQENAAQVTASDPDSDSLTYSISISEINISSSGVLTFASAPDFETKSSYTGTVAVSDGTLRTTQNIAVSIGNISESGENPSSPALSGFFDSEGTNENFLDIVTWGVSDADGDTISVSLSGADAASFTTTFTNSGNSLKLSFANLPDYESPSDVDGNNIYLVTIILSDRGEVDDWTGTAANTSTYNLAVTVRDVAE